MNLLNKAPRVPKLSSALSARVAKYLRALSAQVSSTLSDRVHEYPSSAHEPSMSVQVSECPSRVLRVLRGTLDWH